MCPNRFKLVLVFTIVISFASMAQVGIGTINPDPSSLLDISSNTQGLLVPRMMTAQRTAIQDPAQGLLVYDTTLNEFFFYTGTTWVLSLSQKKERDSYVLVKSEADFPMPAGGVITLDENTYYEINGTITLTQSINLNDAYISGRDASEDVLSFPGGTVFAGSTGGSIRNLTLTGGKAFNISAQGYPAVPCWYKTPLLPG